MPQTELFPSSELFALDNNSGLPLYHQVANEVSQRIARLGVPDQLLPSEDVLMSIFGVSRITIRQAIEKLAKSGLVEKRRGIGTRILRTRIVEDLGRLRGYTEEVNGEGLTVRTEVLNVSSKVCTGAAKKALKLKKSERTVSIHRLRGTNQVFPVMAAFSEIPANTGVTSEDDFSSSCYRLLASKYQLPVMWADQEITAMNASAEEAELLNIPENSAVLVIERVAYSVGDRPVEYVRAVFNPEHYSFSVKLKS